MTVKSSRVLRFGVVLGLAAVVGLVVVGVNVARAQATDDAARSAAATYADLVATAEEDDLERLWSMTVAESPGALRTAAQLLLGAEERIEVIDVGEPKESEPVDVPYPARFDRFVQVFVTYRLDGEEHERPVGLGLLTGEDGAEESDWRVVLPLTSEIGWTQPGFADVAQDVYIGDVRQVRRPLVLGGDEDTQPLYPAVYRTQSRLDPWFASEIELVTVVAGTTALPPDYRLDPTERTQTRIAGQLLAAFDDCGTEDIGLDCPVDDLVERHGVNTYRPGWWLGFTTEPQIEVDHQGLTLSEGVFRFRTSRGVRTARVDGTCPYLIDNQSWTPVLAGWECEIDGAVR